MNEKERVYREQTIENETIEMDEVVLLGCTLKHCTMVFRGGRPCFPGTRWEDTVIVYRGAAACTIELLVNVFGWKPPLPPFSVAQGSTPGPEPGLVN